MGYKNKLSFVRLSILKGNYELPKQKRSKKGPWGLGIVLFYLGHYYRTYKKEIVSDIITEKGRKKVSEREIDR